MSSYYYLRTYKHTNKQTHMIHTNLSHTTKNKIAQITSIITIFQKYDYITDFPSDVHRNMSTSSRYYHYQSNLLAVDSAF